MKSLTHIFPVLCCGIVLGAASIPSAWGTAMFAEQCATDTQKAALWITTRGGVAGVHTKGVELVAEQAGKTAIKQAATKATGVLTAITVGAEGGTWIGSGAWRISQGFWTLLGKKDPTSEMPDATKLTVVRQIDDNQIYSMLGINQGDVAEASTYFPIVQTTTDMIGDTLRYDAAIEAFTTAYTKFLIAELDGNKALASSHAKDVISFAPLVRETGNQLKIDAVADQDAWGQFRAFVLDFTGVPVELTALNVEELQSSLSADGFPIAERSMMDLFGFTDDLIQSLIDDALTYDSQEIANLSFANTTALYCDECTNTVVNEVLRDVPEPNTLSIVALGIFLTAFARNRVKGSGSRGQNS